jgi:hypothetical protein
VPDPLTHVCLAYLVGRAARLRRGLVAFLIGTLLPDLLTSAPTTVLGGYWFWAPAHTPMGVLVWGYAASLLFRREDRRLTFGCLVAGGWLALALDAFQDHISGGYMLLFPFSWAEYELHVIGPEASLSWLPYLVGAVGLVELCGWLRRRRASPKRA